jgi:two-component sensor histidine kinase
VDKKEDEIKRLHSRLRELKQELSAGEARFQNIAGKNKDGMLILDREGTIIYANRSARVILDRNTAEIIGEPFGILIEGDYESEISILSAIGSPRIVELRVSEIEWEGKPSSLVFIHDITRRTQEDLKLKKALEEKEVLLKELQHRVRNNLQVISSLMTIQELRIKDKTIVDLFREISDRVRAMVLIHEKLYQTGDFSRIDFQNYIHSLLMHLSGSYSLKPGQVRWKLEVEDIFLNFDTAISLGLIVNELVSNFFKYVCLAKRKGYLEVYLGKSSGEKEGEEDSYKLTIRDNGVGIPERMDFQDDTNLGIMLVYSLVKKLHGHIDLEKKEGTTFTIKFREFKK